MNEENEITEQGDFWNIIDILWVLMIIFLIGWGIGWLIKKGIR